MSARKRPLEAAAVLALLCCAHGAAAQTEEGDSPALEFLEYLGSWEESDEDWMLFNELDGKPATVKETAHDDAEAAVEESTESEHDG